MSNSSTTTTTKLPLSSSPDLINEQQYCSCRCNPNENEKNHHPNHHHYNGCLYCHKNYTKEEEEDKEKDKVLMCQFCSTINTTTSLPSSLTSSSTSTKSKSKLYQPITKCQLRQHTNIKSGGIWILCNSKIYDVTTYIQYHPGGINSILNKSGGIIDCSYDFSFHSHKAKKLWNSMIIGYLVPCGGGGSGDGGGHNHYHRGQQSNYSNDVKKCINSRSGNSSNRSSDSYYYDNYDGRLRDEGKTRNHDNDHAIFHNSINSTLIETTTTTNQCAIS